MPLTAYLALTSDADAVHIIPFQYGITFQQQKAKLDKEALDLGVHLAQDYR